MTHKIKLVRNVEGLVVERTISSMIKALTISQKRMKFLDDSRGMSLATKDHSEEDNAGLGKRSKKNEKNHPLDNLRKVN